jgi:septal ring factor EnvC (AmiA/AmiB activator)
LDQERRRANQLENELKSLKIKYDDVCERISGATHKLEHVQNVLDQTSRRCEQLEKEKVQTNSILLYVVYILFYNSTSSASKKIGIILMNAFFLLLLFFF